MNKIAILDWDGTLSQGFSILEWIKFLSIHFNEKQYQNELNTEYKKYQTGKLKHDEFSISATSIYANFLKDKKVSIIEDLAVKFVREKLKNMSTDVAMLFYVLKKKEIKAYVLSGAPNELLKIYSRIYNFRIIGSLQLGKTKGKYNGEIILNSGVTIAKKNIVDKLLEKGNVLILGFGNSESDLPIIESAKNGFVMTDSAAFINKYNIVNFDNFFDLIIENI